MKEEFSTCGHVVRADIETSADGRSKGFGIVKFETHESALAAIGAFLLIPVNLIVEVANMHIEVISTNAHTPYAQTTSTST